MPAQRTRDIHSRTLDVTTDAPAPTPSFNIVSPTPRAFTFPMTNNLSDSPYSSRSNSPFDTDPNSFPSHPQQQQQQQCTINTSQSSYTPPPQQSPMRTDSPPSPTVAVDLQRRKSSCSSSESIVDRRPKKGEDDYIKRPENAFILFRRKCCEERQAAQDEAAVAKGPAKKQRQADLSKTISQQWKSLTNEERAKWEAMAKNKKLEHEKRYPHYVYRPQRAKDKDGRTKNNKKVKKLDYDEAASLSFLVPVARQHGRSASAPSPPPYQSIQIPNVYHMPSSPTSPSLLPMISRRSAYPGHPEDVMSSSFDFLPPSQPYVPPSYAMSGQFEATLQSSEFLRSMFGPTPAQQPITSSPLQHISIPGPTDTNLQISPSSSVGSGSSGPSSPTSGPYTPNSTMLTHNFAHLAPDASLEAQAQAEMDLQMEMQMQQEFAAYNWESNNSLWSSEPSILMGDDFDISAIRPVELTLPKYTESISLPTTHCSGLEFGQDFSHVLDGVQYHDESRSLGIIGFDEMMAGHGF